MSSPPPGIDGILAVLDTNSSSSTPSMMGGGANEMLRNETLLLLPPMLAGSQDLQKIVAFSGAFEKLFQIIDQEGGADGGIVVQDALAAVACLLRFNVSNQVHLVYCYENKELTALQRITFASSPSSLKSHGSSASLHPFLPMSPHLMNSPCNTGLIKKSTIPAWSWV